jgi:hypothetical protein
VYTGFWWGNLRKSGHLEDAGVDGRIILRWVWGGMDWNYLAQDRDRWQAILHAVMNLQFSFNMGNFLTS